ncbi:MAG: transcription antitermination factor NusB [Polyangiaceae bacterium]|nr:transcription antitermination factor NusB [Polyangiaceae bacterium]
MGARHSGRQAALQMLFQLEASAVSAERAIDLFWRMFEDADPEGRSYAEQIVCGVESSLSEIDKKIEEASQNWRLMRMSRVDRNLLRLGTWELMFKPDVPRAVILDESVELAKSFGSEESSGFVNGVLDRIASDLGRTA